MKPTYLAYTLQFSPLFLIATLFGKADPALSQASNIVPDSTLGAESSVVNSQDENSDSIDGGALRGSNLFHSFQEFNVGEGRGVYFANPDAVSNIFSRVTGNNRSNILGTLGVDGAANLYLINPNGIVFGEGAALDVQGSFTATTAKGIEFGEGGLFSAVAPGESLLTISVPLGLQFGSNPGSIINRSKFPGNGDDNVGLQVPTEENLTLVGGEVRFETGQATVRGGNINIGGLGAAGTVGLNDDGSLSYPNDLAKTNINLFDGAIIDVVSEEGGSINLNARDVNLMGGSRIIGGLIATGVNLPNAEAGDININATNDVALSGVNTTTNLNSAVQNNVESEAIGNSGDVNIFARNLIVTNGAQIQTTVRRQNFRGQGLAAGNGNAGDINIKVLDSVTISGISDETINLNGLEINAQSLISSSLESGATGEAGKISIISNSLLLNDGGQILSGTSGIGDAGNITFKIGKELSLDGGIQAIQLGIPVPALTSISSSVNAGGEGNGGIIDIQAQNLSLTNGAQIISIASQSNSLSELAAGNGKAGDIILNVEEAITISEVSDIFNFNGVEISFPSLISSSLDNGATGEAGVISIISDSLLISDGGQILNSTFGNGDAGDIDINVENSIELNGINSIFAIDEAFNTNQGLAGGIYSAVESGAIGNSGVIDIQARNLSLKDGAQIQTTIRQGNPQFGLAAGNGIAGDIDINVEDAVTISGVSEVFNLNGLNNSSPSLILSALDFGATGQAGEISITSNSLLLENGGQITASTVGKGNAGNISLDISEDINLNGATGFFAQGNSLIASSAVFSTVEAGGEGNGGVIDIQARNLFLTDGGEVNASTSGQGDAGNIIFDVSNFLQAKNSSISTSSLQSSGGNLTITAGDMQLQDNSDFTTNISSGEGGGGNINITANSIVAFDDSDIFAFAADGQGGNITLNTPAFFAENFTLNSLTTNPSELDFNDRADVNATGAVSSGAVEIPDVSFIQNSLTELPNNSLNTDELVANSCVVPVGDRSQGKFIITGGESLPVRPGGNLPSKYPTGEVRGASEDNTSSWQPGDPIVEPQGAYRLANGEWVLSRECSQ